MNKLKRERRGGIISRMALFLKLKAERRYNVRMLKQGSQRGRRAERTADVPLGYVEDCFSPRTKLEPCFSIRYREMRRSISFHRANTIMPTSKNRPTCCAISRWRSPNGLRKMPSMVKNSKCPPSRIGIGKRLSTPRLMLSKAINEMTLERPCCPTSPAILAIVSGPPIFLLEISPEIIL